MQPIGAFVRIQFDGETQEFNKYISFLEYQDNAFCDAAGIPDDQIFFYFGDENALKTRMAKSPEGFTVIGYQLAFREV